MRDLKITKNKNLLPKVTHQTFHKRNFLCQIYSQDFSDIGDEFTFSSLPKRLNL